MSEPTPRPWHASLLGFRDATGLPIADFRREADRDLADRAVRFMDEMAAEPCRRDRYHAFGTCEVWNEPLCGPCRARKARDAGAEVRE